MNAIDKRIIVQKILEDRSTTPASESVTEFAPTNFALIKYWGKRDDDLFLPKTPSLSITLPCWGATTTVALHDGEHDQLTMNQTSVKRNSPFYERTIAFVDLLRAEPDMHFSIDTQLNIPFAAGLASSACGFAALSLAFNRFFQWKLSPTKLSIISRMGSGSASRSFWPGFVEWQQGSRHDGMDCHGIPLPYHWPDLRIGLLIVNESTKITSSTAAMKHTMATSKLYQSWPDKVEHDLHNIKVALEEHNFERFGSIAESNAISMHATMLAAEPPVIYPQIETWQAIQKIHKLRKDGLKLFFTEDAGPNLKLIFEACDEKHVLKHFPNCQITKPFPEKKTT